MCIRDRFYGHPSGKLKVIGLTGTKGKSSTAYYLKYILDEYMAEREKPESGIISSIDTYDGVERFESHLTTPEDVYKRQGSSMLAAGVPTRGEKMKVNRASKRTSSSTFKVSSNSSVVSPGKPTMMSEVSTISDVYKRQPLPWAGRPLFPSG